MYTNDSIREAVVKYKGKVGWSTKMAPWLNDSGESATCNGLHNAGCHNTYNYKYITNKNKKGKKPAQ